MLKTPGNVTAQDLSRWYRKGWVGVKGFTEPRWVVNVLDHPTIIIHTSGDKGAVEAGSQPKDVYAHWPRLGAVNVFGFAVHVMRLPLRLYRRTYNDEVLDYIVPNSWEVSTMYGEPRTLIATRPRELASALWNPAYPSVGKAMKSVLMDGAVSVAISRTTILASTGTGGKVGVFYNGVLVGYNSPMGGFWACGVDMDYITNTKLQKELSK